MLNLPHLAKFKDALFERAGLKSSVADSTKACRPSQIIKSEQRVQSVLRLLQKEFVNPFSDTLDKDKLYNLSSGAPVTDVVKGSVSSVFDNL